VVKQDVEISEGRIRTEEAKMEGQVSVVQGQVGLQDAIIEEMFSGIAVLQTQDNMIVQEVSSIFQGIDQQIANIIKTQITNGSTLLNHEKAIVKIQEENKTISEKQGVIEETIEVIQNYLDLLPTKKDLLNHTKAMDETVLKIQEVSPGSTTHME